MKLVSDTMKISRVTRDNVTNFIYAKMDNKVFFFRASFKKNSIPISIL